MDCLKPILLAKSQKNITILQFFANSIEQMMKDYFLRLKDLRQDRLVFQTEKQKTNLNCQMNRQEDKYQAYIIQQMNDKNRIIAAVKIVNTLVFPIRLQLQSYFEKCAKNNDLTQIEGKKTNLSQISSKNTNNDSMINEVEMLLLKYSVQSITRVIQKASLQQKKQAFCSISKHVKNSKKIYKIERLANKLGLKTGFTAIRGFDKQKPAKPTSTCNNLFEDQFSVIYRQESKKQKGNTDESYLSFIFQKENVNIDHQPCQQCKLVTEKDKQLTKMKEEIAYLKALLSQKNIQIMKKDQLYKKLQKESTEEVQQSANLSKNSSYYSELEKYVTGGGGKRIRKNGSRVSESSNPIPKEEISSELLGKYMRQSFQLKETIDVARELCLQLRNSVTKSQRAQMWQIVKVLSFGQEVSLVDQY